MIMDFAKEEITKTENSDGKSMQGLQFLKTNRGSEKVCFNGYLYVCYRKCKEYHRWICAQKHSKKCRGQLLTDLDNSNPRAINEHNHSPTPMEKVLATKALQEMKRLCKETGATPQKILADAVKGMDASILAHLPSKDSAMRSMRYLRTASEKRKLKEMVQYVNSDVDTQAFMQAQQYVDNGGESEGFYSVAGSVLGDNYAVLAERYSSLDESESNPDGSSQIKITNSKITDEQWEVIMNCIDSNSLLLKDELPTTDEIKQMNRLWDYLTGVLNSERNGCKKNSKNWQKALEDYKTQLMWTVEQQDKWSARDHKLYTLITKHSEEQNVKTDDDTNSTETSVTQRPENAEQVVTIKCEIEEDSYTDHSHFDYEGATLSEELKINVSNLNAFKIFAAATKSDAAENGSSPDRNAPNENVPESSTCRKLEAIVPTKSPRKYSFARRNFKLISIDKAREARRRNREIAANTAAILAQTAALKELANAMRLVAESNFKLVEKRGTSK